MNTNRTRLGSLGSTKKARCLVWLFNQQEGGREGGRNGEKRERHAHTHSKSSRVASVLQTKTKIKRKDRLALAIGAIWAKTKPNQNQSKHKTHANNTPQHTKKQTNRNPSTKNLCSKCYRDFQAAENTAAAAAAAVNSTATATVASPKATTPQTAAESSPAAAAAAPASPAPAPSPAVAETAAAISPHCPPCAVVADEQMTDAPAESAAAAAAADEPPPVQTNHNRCWCCNKKVGLLGFKCRCSYTFCASHRQPEEHTCTFDFKAMGRDLLEKNNPSVVAAKVDKI